MNINVVFCFAILLALNSSVDSIEFCKDFRGNGDKISYVLRSDMPTEGDIYVTGYNFIINGYKWLAKFKDDPNSKPEMEFIGNESQSTPFFSGDYQIAVWLWFTDNTTKYATLFRKNNFKSLTFGWTQYKQDRFKLDHYNQDLSLDIELTLSSDVKQPNIIFQENVDKLVPNSSQTFVFIYQDSLKKPLTVKRFQIDYIENEMKITSKVLNATPEHMNGFKELIPKYELISVIYQWTHYNNRYSYVYLFQDNAKIRWCVSDGQHLDKDWCQTNPSIFIDCTSTEKPTNSTLIPVSPTTNYTLIAAIVVVFVVIIILIGIVVYLCRSFGKETTTQSSTQSNQLPSKSSVKTTNQSKDTQTSQTSGMSSVQTINSNTGKPVKGGFFKNLFSERKN